MSAFIERQRRYPDLLAYPGWDDLMHSQLAWGFDCGPGWLPLIDIALATLNWGSQHAPTATIHVRQVKEKFGRLTIYADLSNVPPPVRDGILSILSHLADLSTYTCEQCGQAGALRSTGGWWQTLCDACETAWQTADEPLSQFRIRLGREF
ncbi:hypothetical protein TPY_2642 [Sulfobacillus acidophilus TPY]|uniref:Uncharacterized protein n=1 Tax=Sulfobacillus acidophilus (strain ATCC 700253 / DSM 10332 / NAL) TaxID=679936 RepID=G8TV98_SULAD|nr:hypothetical protein TPY_2642 [Sulfobacillus acidophilus TPY]AEW04738.1 hypothetical protein Sulac_1238 [Sulfobacillus acidophilus DSM 10332]